jgi:hypothetical protein
MNDQGRWAISQALARAKGCQAERVDARDRARLHFQDCEQQLAYAQANVEALTEALAEAGGIPVVKAVEVAA